MDMFQCSHYGKQFSSGDTAIPLCVIQRLTVVGYNQLLSVMYLGEHSSNSDLTGVCDYYELLSWFWVGENLGSTQGSL
jgi:hypothetical protein